MNKKHQKHAKLARPDIGFFCRTEWAILGTPCGKIKELSFHLIKALSVKYKMAYVDADHKSTDDSEIADGEKTAMNHGAAMEYTDKISHHRFESKASFDSHQYRSQFNGMDAVLVNGNHFTANSQIVVIDEKKLESLQRKTDRLTNIVLVLLEKGMTEIPDFVKPLMNEQTIVLKIEEREKITAYLHILLLASVPSLAGLVLAGGKSQRMGEDKGLIEYHGKPHREYIHDLIAPFCEETYISCRPDQIESLSNYPTLPDSFQDLGPFGALLSAFRQKPDHAWMVVACDYPLLDNNTITKLLNYRNPSKVATAFNNPNNAFPEPLITIWEPRSYFELLRFLGQGYSCPRKVLINTDVEVIPVEESELDVFRNANTEADRDAVMKVVKNK
ncbi:MAG: NTP transferase domain-containing protein [Saprospiraceae bacterium]